MLLEDAYYENTQLCFRYLYLLFLLDVLNCQSSVQNLLPQVNYNFYKLPATEDLS